MIGAAEITFWVFACTLVYVYVGYPLLLAMLRPLINRSPIETSTATPPLTLIISAFNEAEVIEQKIENSLALDYPRGSLDVVVVSDASNDGTDEKVARYASQSVRLIRMPQRGGKTLGLNEGVAQARGEIIVFSDANAMYRSDALRMLVRNFADSRVGAVVGESTYTTAANHPADNESGYWRYETAIKRLESEVGSVVGGDGAIYAIRRDCYEPMTADALSDFVNPLQIVQQGYRCIYEPAAISIEAPAGSFEKEFKRKVRIVNRAWRATLRSREMLNPFRYGFFAVQLLSHKVLRWFVPVLLLGLLATNATIAGQHWFYAATLFLQSALYLLALVSYLLRDFVQLPFVLSVPMYFCLVNLASLKGIAEAHFGKSYTTWTTVRAK